MAGMDRIVSSQKEKAHVFLQNNQFAEARDLYARICAKNKMDAEAWFMLGAINGQLGCYEEAIECFKRVIALQPSAEGFDNLGLAFYHQGQLEAAANSFQQALALNTDFARSHFNLGLVFKDQGNYAAAVERFGHAVRLMPAWFEAVSNLGVAYSCLGMLRESIKWFEQAIHLHPNNIPMHLALADAFMKQQDFQAALSSYQKVLRLDGTDAETLNKIGIAFQHIGNNVGAVECFKRAIERNKDFEAAYLNLGHALTTLMKFDEALGAFSHVLALSPAHYGAVAGIVNLYEKQGDYEKSYETIKPFVDRGIEDVELAVQFGVASSRMNRQADACGVMEHLLEKKALSNDEKRRLHFGLGALYDKLADYDKAFSHFRDANDLSEKNPGLTAENARWVDRIIATFSLDFLAGGPRSEIVTDCPIFIVGMPRSGTSLVEQILASHPQAYGAGELMGLWDIVGSFPAMMSGMAYPECLERLTVEQVTEAAKTYLNQISQLSNGASFVTDKMPSNFFHLGLIQLLFPGAKIIHCLRDPVDTCLSCYFQDFAGRHTYSTDLEYLGTYYRDYERLMAHWRQVLNMPVMEINYKELIEDPENGSRHLVEFCGLRWDDQCLRFYETKRIINTASYDQVRKPIYRSSVARWKHYEKHLSPLMRALFPG